MAFARNCKCMTMGMLNMSSVQWYLFDSSPLSPHDAMVHGMKIRRGIIFPNFVCTGVAVNRLRRVTGIAS